MKNSKISDLLDYIQEDSIELEWDTNLSSQRIKEITMKRITKEKAPRRMLSKVILAAALTVVLTISVVAAEKWEAGEWFRDILSNQESDHAKLEEYVTYISQVGRVYNKSYAGEGMIVTPLAGFGDENVLYFRIRVEEPEGNKIPDVENYSFFGSWEQRDMILGCSDDLTYGMWVLPDSESEDNQKEFLVRICSKPGSEKKLNDGSTIQFHIYGLYQRDPVEGGVDEFRELLPGEFVLDLSMFNSVQMTKVDVTGISYQKQELGTIVDTSGENQNVEYSYNVMLNAFCLSPLSAYWECEIDSTDPTWKTGIDFQIVMLDGTVVGQTYKTVFDEDSLFASKGFALFDVPIALDQVDYILFGNQYKVFLP